MFAILGVIVWIVIFAIFWPITLAYGIHKLSENILLTTILTSTATISSFVIQFMYPDIIILAAAFSILFALFAWMYVEAK